MNQPMTVALAVLLSAGAMFAQQKNRNRTDNESLLGIVTTEEDAGVTIAHVLKKSPARRAKLAVGDVLLEVAGKKIEQAIDIDDALGEVNPGTKVKIEYRRGEDELTVEAKVIARKKYRGKFLDRQSKKVGFEAPKWWGYAWANTSKKQPAPTRENTRDKVVVFHTFQSW